MSDTDQDPIEPDAETAPKESVTEPMGAEQPQEDGYQEKWQRALAELENQRKRHAQESQNFARFALQSFLEELLPVVDNFYRATEYIPADQKDSPWVAGIQYIQKNLMDTLERQGVTEITVKLGEPFNPEQEEAIGTEEVPEAKPEDRIAQVKQRGYLLHGKVLRPAQVIVTKHQNK